MIGAFVIAFREVIEAGLIALIVLAASVPVLGHQPLAPRLSCEPPRGDYPDRDEQEDRYQFQGCPRRDATLAPVGAIVRTSRRRPGTARG